MPGLHEELLEAVGLELGTPIRRRAAGFRVVLGAYVAECCVCGFSLRLVDGLIGVDAANIQWHSHGGVGSKTVQRVKAELTGP